VATNWAGWSEGESLAECLAANASDIGDHAKQGVIDYGLDDVYDQLSRADSYSLGIVWDRCQQQPLSGAGDSESSSQSGETAAAPSDEPTDLSAHCTFYAEQLKVSCQVSGKQPGSSLKWTSDASSAYGAGKQWEFIIQGPVGQEARVSLEECQGSTCITISIVLDTSEGSRDSDYQGRGNAVEYPTSELSAADLVRRWSWRSGSIGCEGSGSRMLSHYPLKPDDINFIYPLGALTQSHITPVSHNYIFPKRDVVADVVAPVDGYVVKMSNRNASEVDTDSIASSAAGLGTEIHYIIEVSCDFYVVLDHVVDPPEPFLSAVGDTFDVRTRIPIQAGDLLGRQREGNKVDLSIVDLTRGETTAYVDNMSYYSGEYGEPYKLFEQDSFEYLTEPLLTEVIEKSLRTEDPRGGTFAYDVNGTAMGNWFRDGTGGYAGNTELRFTNYFAGHLALVPDALSPEELRVSIGDGFKDESWGSNWGVIGSAPDFRDVTVSSGPTKFGLESLHTCDPAFRTDYKSPEHYVRCPAGEAGTLMVELLDDRTMRAEVFFNEPSDSDLTFTDNARIYVR